MNIIHNRESGYDEKNDAIIYYDDYIVVDNSNVRQFAGSYAQCLIFVGALTMGKSLSIAAQFARGTYR